MTIMNITNFQLLSLNELEGFWGELDFAIEEHSRWLSELNRTLLFKNSASGDDIADDAHLRYHFGRWYQSQENSDIITMPSFIKIGEIHREIHAIARNVLLEIEKGEPVEVNEYDQLMKLSERLRGASNELKRNIKSDISTISMLLSKVFEYATEGVMITSRDATILNVNKAFTKVTGYSHKEAVGETPHILYSGRHDEDYYHKMWHALNTLGYWEGEIWDRKKSGEIYPEYLTISALTDNNGEVSHYIGIFADVSNKSVNQEKLYHLAHYDALTELPNRILFYDRLRHAISRAKREKKNIAVLFIDLDGFKPVNDQYGHKEGDNLLKQVTRRIKRCVRESDTVSRFGGDEFTVVLPDIGEEGDMIAAKIVAAIGGSYSIDGHPIHVTASVGISLYSSSEAKSAESILREADLAMYAAKRSGKNRFCHYHESMG